MNTPDDELEYTEVVIEERRVANSGQGQVYSFGTMEAMTTTRPEPQAQSRSEAPYAQQEVAEHQAPMPLAAWVARVVGSSLRLDRSRHSNGKTTGVKATRTECQFSVRNGSCLKCMTPVRRQVVAKH